MTIKNITWFCLMLFSCISMSAWSISTTPVEKVRLQLKWTHQFQFAGYYAAKEQGYYADAGLEVEFIERSLEKSPVTEVAMGKAEYGISSSGLLLDRVRGTRIKALAAIFQHNPISFMLKNHPVLLSPMKLRVSG